MVIVQGNTYRLPIRVKINGNVITDKDVKIVEFTFGCSKKKYPQEVTFEDDCFIVPMSQKDTLSLPTKKPSRYQVRVMFKDDSVKGTDPKEFVVTPSESKEVLG